MLKNLFVVGFVFLGLVACVPTDGPTPFQVEQDAVANDIPILRLSDTVITQLGTADQSFDFSSFTEGEYTPGVIMPGDVVSVAVFEGSDDGMFAVENASSLGLGEFAVSPSGTISLPFVGTIRVAGNTVTAAQRVITERLRQQAVEPFATVQITVNASDAVVVQGAVNDSGPVPLTPRGETVLDAIAAAGGATGDPADTIVTLTRGTHRHQQLLSVLFENPRQNVPLRPGDVISVGGGEASFIADGAMNLTGEFDFVEGEMSLAQAIAMAGGLLDSRADPSATYVFRRQGQGESFTLQEQDGTTRQVTGDLIFRVDYNNPRERLDAQEFQLRDGDIVYVGNSPVANFLKLFRIFSQPPEVPPLPQP